MSENAPFAVQHPPEVPDGVARYRVSNLASIRPLMPSYLPVPAVSHSIGRSEGDTCCVRSLPTRARTAEVGRQREVRVCAPELGEFRRRLRLAAL